MSFCSANQDAKGMVTTEEWAFSHIFILLIIFANNEDAHEQIRHVRCTIQEFTSTTKFTNFDPIRLKLHIYPALALPLLAFAHFFIVEHIETPYHRIQIHDNTIHVHEPRDGTSLEIKSSISISSVNKIQNNANGKFGVINNAKSANVAMGDNSKHTADFHSFRHKKMPNSTGSNTGDWNTKNHGKTLIANQKRKSAEASCLRRKRKEWEDCSL
jgi:hypothetical protein